MPKRKAPARTAKLRPRMGDKATPTKAAPAKATPSEDLTNGPSTSSSSPKPKVRMGDKATPTKAATSKATPSEDLTNGPSTSSSSPKPKGGSKKRAATGSPRAAGGSASANRSPLVKRKRTQAEYYQSDVIEAISKSPAARTPIEDKELFYDKGSYLAVRNEVGQFYICQTQQNVYKTTKTFKVQWLEQKAQPDLFEMSFYDSVEAGAVLTIVRVEKAKEKNLWRLSKIDIERVEKILELAKKKERGEWDENQALPPILTMELDTSKSDNEDDDEEDSEEEADEDKPSTSTARKVLKMVMKKGKRGRPKVKPIASVQLKSKTALKNAKQEAVKDTTTGRGRPRKAAETTPTTKPAKAKKAAKVSVKGKKVKLKKVKSIKKKKEKEKKEPKKKLHPNEKLTQRPDIDVVSKDPMFEVKSDSKTTKAVSKFVLCKHAIRAVLTNDTALLKKLLENAKEVPSCFIERSVDTSRDALSYAIQLNNIPAIKLLAEQMKDTSKGLGTEEKRVDMPKTMLQQGNAGEYNFKVLGHAVRQISQGRGSREGNDAFTKDVHQMTGNNLYHMRQYAECALEDGITPSTYDQLCTLIPTIKDNFDGRLGLAVKAGHRKLAAHLIEKAFTSGGHGFNKLHTEVLSCDKPEELSTFRAPSVKKKPYESDKITPLHCAAINPNPNILGKLLSVLPEYNLPDRKQNKPIHYAAACESTGPLELLISRGINPEETNNMGVTPLMVAAKYGCLHNVEVLLKKASDEPNTGVHHKDSMAYYAIHYASEEGHTDCVKSLIKHGADIEVMTSAGKNKMTPVMLASRKGHLQTVKALVELGAIIEKRDKLKKTALIHAVINGNYPVTSFLLRKGADANVKDSSGNTPAHYAAAYGWYHSLKLLFTAGADPNQPNDWKIPPLGIALMKGHQGMADLILEQPGVDLNFRDDSGSTLVMLTAACRMTKNIVDQMEYLVKKKGAKVDLVDVNGQNALHYLAVSPLYAYDDDSRKSDIKNSLEVAQLLIDHGAKLLQLNKDGESAVNIALKADLCNSDLVAMLIKQGTTVSTGQNSEGQNVLHLMAKQCKDNNQAPLLRVLAETLKAKVNNHVTDKKETKPTPADTKDTSQPMEVDGAKPTPIQQPPPQPLQPLQASVIQQNSTAPPPLVKASTLPVLKPTYDNNCPTSLKEMANVADNKGYTPLLTCVETYASTAETKPSQNALDMMQALLDVGDADVNVRTKESSGLNSAVHFLAKIEEQSMTRQCRQIPRPGLKLLLKYKANINLKDKQGRTPLIAAILAKKTTTAKFLIESGADVNISSDNEKDDGKGTPLVLAALNNLHDVIPALLNKGADEWAKDCRNNMMALHYAAQSRDLVSDVVASVKALLRSGINVNAVDKEGRTALHYAINADSGGSDSSTEVVETLIDKRANVYARDMYGRLPLHLAFIKLGQPNDNSHIDPIEMLSVVSEAMKGQQMNLQDKLGQTPLHGAALRGAAICCMYIVERVKDFDVRDRNQNTPLALAVMGQHDSVAIMLIQKGANINTNVTRAPPELEKEEEEKQEKKKYWLWKPVRPSPPSPTVKSLLREIIDHEWQGVTFLAMDRLDRFQMSYANAVQGALEAHKYQLVLSMIRKQKNPQKLQVFNTRRRNLLHVLAINGMTTQGSELQVQVASELFQRGFKLYMKDDRGCTPLHYAAVAQNLPLCKIFAEKDPDGFRNCITSQDLKGRVPMAALVWSYRFDDNTQALIKLFLKHGGSLNIRSPLPKLDASTAQHMKKPESLEELYHSGQDKLVDLTPLSLMIYAQNWQALKFLVQNGADPNFTDKLELSPMMHAVKQNELDLVKILCNPDYEPHKKNKNIAKTAQTFASWAVDIWEKKKEPLRRQNSYALSWNGNWTEEEEESSQEVEETVEEEEEEEEEEEIDSDDEDAAAKRKAKQEKKAIELKKEQDKFVKTSKVSLTAVDVHGRSIVHHTVKTCNHGTYENVPLLELLVELGAPTDLKDRHGQTPLDYAIRGGTTMMACALQRLMKIPEDKWVKPESAKHVWSDGISWDSGIPDFDIDSKEMVKTLHQGVSNKEEAESDKPPVAVVEQLSQLREGGEVVIDTAQNIPYDVLMTKVDVKYGVYGMNNFYKMQVIHQKGKEMYLLFTRWGRIGEDGQFQRTPFNTKEEAVSEFSKIFKAKTGNAWNNIKSFQKESKKYQVVKRDPWVKERRKAIKKFEFDLESKLPSKLPTAVQEVLKHLTSKPMLTAALKASSVDTDLWNFGNIPRDTLHKAKEILLKIRENLEEAEAVQQATFSDSDKHQTLMEKIADMSSEFFELIPYHEFSWDKIQPLTSDEELSTAVQKLTNLMDLELTNRILLGAHHKMRDVSPVDYVYRSLECQMQLLDENSTEAQLILQHIQNTKGEGQSYRWGNQPKATNIKSIFRISRKGEEERLAACNLDNHMLLWHGSSSTNLISILKRGLLVTPPEAPITGFRFGRGIYSADSFAKSITYCDSYHNLESDTKYMLLCEVALGKVDDQKNDFTTELRPAYNSIKGCGRRYPDPRHNLLLPSGAILPLGKLTNSSAGAFSLEENEYIVYKSEQVCVRYLVVCE